MVLKEERVDAENEMVRRTVRLPDDAAEFLRQQAEKHCTSQNSELVRSVRERMDRENASPSAGATVTGPTA
jgi:predicted transcriptional regulator